MRLAMHRRKGKRFYIKFYVVFRRRLQRKLKLKKYRTFYSPQKKPCSQINASKVLN